MDKIEHIKQRMLSASVDNLKLGLDGLQEAKLLLRVASRYARQNHEQRARIDAAIVDLERMARDIARELLPLVAHLRTPLDVDC